MARASLSLATMLFRVLAGSRPRVESGSLLRASILFRPRDGSVSSFASDCGGAAGYRPRVRNVYSKRGLPP